MCYFFIDYLRFKKVDYLIAPYEADYQLIKMYEQKVIDYICSEDSDILVYSCRHVIKNLKLSGECQILTPRSIKQLKLKLDKK